MEDKVSIVVAIYNVAQYLEQCLSSIVEQTYINTEIILVNDGSTDNSASICEKFGMNDRRVKIISQPNGGLVSARKAGSKIATGDYILFVDGDDWLDKHMVEKLIKPVSEYNDPIDMIVCNFSFDYEEHFVINKVSLQDGIYDKDKIEQVIIPQLIEPRIIESSLWCKLIRTEIVQKNIIDIEDEIQIGEDTILTTATVLEARNLIFLGKEPLYHYRQNENSMTKKYKTKYFEKSVILERNLIKIVYKKQHLELIPQIHKLLVNFAMLSIENEYIAKYHNVKQRKAITKSIVNDRNLRMALKDVDTKQLNIKNRIYFFLIKRRLITFLCWMNLIIRGLRK